MSLQAHAAQEGWSAAEKGSKQATIGCVVTAGKGSLWWPKLSSEGLSEDASKTGKMAAQLKNVLILFVMAGGTLEILLGWHRYCGSVPG